MSRTRLLAFSLAVCSLGCGEVDVVGRVAPAFASPDSATTVEDASATSGQDAGPPGACGRAPQIFDQALCACTEATVGGDLVTVTLGDGPPAAHVRAGGPLTLARFAGPLSGDLTIAGSGMSVLVSDDGRIAGSMRVATALALQGLLTVTGDAWLAGPVFGLDQLVVEGTTLVETGASLPAPCACEAEAALDIAGWAAAARDDNDNRRTGFDGSMPWFLMQGGVQLPAGRLWAERIEVPGDLSLRVSGKTALFANTLVVGSLRAEIGPEGELALFVAGDAVVNGTVQLGDPERPAAARLYVAGEMQVGQPQGESEEWVVNLYAPQLVWVGSGEVRVSGSLYVDSFSTTAGATLRHDPRVTRTTEVCDGW